MSESAADRPEPTTAEVPPTNVPPTTEPSPPPPPASASPPPPPPPHEPPARRPWAQGPGRLVLAVVIAFVAGALVFGGLGAATGFAVGHVVGEHQQLRRDDGRDGHMRNLPGAPGEHRTVPQRPPR